MKNLHRAMRTYKAYKFILESNPDLIANLRITYNPFDNNYSTYVGLTDKELARNNEEIILKYNRNGNTN